MLILAFDCKVTGLFTYTEEEAFKDSGIRYTGRSENSFHYRLIINVFIYEI